MKILRKTHQDFQDTRIKTYEKNERSSYHKIVNASNKIATDEDPNKTYIQNILVW